MKENEEILKKKAVRSWVEWQVVYQLEVFGQNDSHIWCLDFAGEDASIIRGRVGKINLYEGIGCSEFYRLIKNDTDMDQLLDFFEHVKKTIKNV